MLTGHSDWVRGVAWALNLGMLNSNPRHTWACSKTLNTLYLHTQVWRHSEAGGWQQDGPALTGHSDWVRDVAWAPNLGMPANTLASAGQDGRVFIWAEQAGGGWERTLLQDFQAGRPPSLPCCSCSWSWAGGGNCSSPFAVAAHKGNNMRFSAKLQLLPAGQCRRQNGG